MEPERKRSCPRAAEVQKMLSLLCADHSVLICEEDLTYYCNELLDAEIPSSLHDLLGRKKLLKTIERWDFYRNLFMRWIECKHWARECGMRFGRMCKDRQISCSRLMEELEIIVSGSYSMSLCAENLRGCLEKLGYSATLYLTKRDCWLITEVVMNLYGLFRLWSTTGTLRLQEIEEFFFKLRREVHSRGHRLEEEDFYDKLKELLEYHAVFRSNSTSLMAESDVLAKKLINWIEDQSFLRSVDLHIIVGKHIRTACRRRMVCNDELQSFLACPNFIAEEAEHLAKDIVLAMSNKFAKRKPRRLVDDLPSAKFSDLKLDDVKLFHQGLEKKLGFPATKNILQAMKDEHERDECFARSSGQTLAQPSVQDENIVDPKIEWNIVMQNEEWNFTGVATQPQVGIAGRDIDRGIEYYMALLKEKQAEKLVDEGLTMEEVVALRLWTGPMYRRYSRMFRGEIEDSRKIYVTTLHAINSGITKLARKWRIPKNRKVYRGYANVSLQNLRLDEFSCIGGVEPSVLATSEDFDIAFAYSAHGSFILEIDVGQVDRGADLSWLSQFPHEKEILFNAMSNLEVIGEPQWHCDRSQSVMVYPVRVNSNLKSKTLEDFQFMLKELHVSLVDSLVSEIASYLRQASHNLKGNKSQLIDELVSQTVGACQEVVTDHRTKRLELFNEGGDEYLSLVKEAVKLKQQVMSMMKTAVEVWNGLQTLEVTNIHTEMTDWQRQKLRNLMLNLPNVITKANLGGQCFDLISPGLLNVDFGLRESKSRLNSVMDHFFFLLSINTSLTSLNLTSMTIGELGMKHFVRGLSYLPCLRVLNLQHNGMGCAGAQALAASFGVLTNLEILHLDLNGIAARGAEFIAKSLTMISQLAALTLSRNLIREQGAQELSSGIACLPELECLNLSQNLIGPLGAKALARGLAVASNLLELNLSSNRISTTGCNFLQACFHNLPWLVCLDLSENSIGATGATDLAGSLKCIPLLKWLKLGTNKILCSGLEALAASLEALPELEELLLSENSIADAGIKCLAQVFNKISNLKALDLSSNKISDDGIMTLVTQSSCLTSLENLWVSSNDFGNAGREALEPLKGRGCKVHDAPIMQGTFEDDPQPDLQTLIKQGSDFVWELPQPGPIP